MIDEFTCVEICAGAGGQVLGLERAGFRHLALVEYEPECCEVLKKNRPAWNVLCQDIRYFDGKKYSGADLLSGGIPCQPFSCAGRQAGSIESPGYTVHMKLLNALYFGVPQSRHRVIIIAIRNDQNIFLLILKAVITPLRQEIYDLVSANGWTGASEWAKRANKPAPVIVGGSRKHGGADLGSVRSRRAWALMGVNGSSIAYEAPESGHEGMIRLTPKMLARLQGFPDEWIFTDKKTASCRMIGNALPPAVAEAVGKKIKECLINE